MVFLSRTQEAIRKEAGEKDPEEGYILKNRQYKTEYHETTPQTKEVISSTPKMTIAEVKYKDRDDEPQEEEGYNRYDRGYEEVLIHYTIYII